MAGSTGKKTDSTASRLGQAPRKIMRPVVLDDRGLGRMPTGATGPRKIAAKKARLTAFLNTYRETGVMKLSCRAANIGFSTVGDYLNEAKDIGVRGNPLPEPEIELRKWFREEFAAAKTESIDALEGEIYKRAVEGVDRPVFSRGELMEYVKEYSDQLLMFLMKKRNPEYRQLDGGGTQVNVGISAQQNNILQQIVALPEEELMRLAQRGLLPPESE